VATLTDDHVRNFIRGLFGKGNMMLFGCGNAWKIEFDKEKNFPLINTQLAT
jgi:hypothetical protein